MLLLFPSPVPAVTQNFGVKIRQPVPIEEPLPALAVGERLTFDVFWMGIPVGIGTLEVKEKVDVRGRQAFHVVATAKTNDFLSAIYPVEDQVHSFIDAERFCSLEFRKTLKEGRYRADESIVYDYAAKKGFYESLHNNSKKEFDIGDCAHDILSVFYWFRLQPGVEVGKSLRSAVNSEEKNWDLEFKVLKRETKELRGGVVIETLQVEPKTRYKGILYDRGRAWVYFSVDKARQPVWITIKTPFGPVAGVLNTKGGEGPVAAPAAEAPSATSRI